MRNLITAIALLITTISFAQNNLFDNISMNDQYQEYTRVWDAEGDGTYEINDKRYVVKFDLKRLSSGEGYEISAIIDEGKKKGEKGGGYNVIEGYYECSGYPYESYMKHKYQKDGIIAIEDYVFVVRGISTDGTSFKNIDDVYIKIKGEKATGNKKKTKKKKMSFFQKLKEAKNKSKKNPNYGEAHKALQNKNLDKLIKDYLVAMKAKQKNRTIKEKQHDKNIIAAKNKGADEIKRYNDSIKATPKYKRMKAYQKFVEDVKKRDNVTLRNNSSQSIYICHSSTGCSLGTEVVAGGTRAWNCDSDAYIVEGRKVYGKNTGCGKTININ
ncbi:hypothetical protein OD91_0242 [Lutibacter sp. Hel_I_33_5]|uniref:hypothetical protein n=1 Tax=Lutibacter sp. Hel_I_33_5 TaxID=1566289 RepID=UPI0011A9FEAC|nr:hypothetical protein [Lutibacter sp. Hel_I_33_5]TVZ55001.1 hypothetical protein OD91_0242 [Lutibacter sp. Hel_I_33_5]